MVKLTFYSGVNEIGGNKILLEDRGTRIFLDFGKSFTFRVDYFAGYPGPRAINGLGDYFEFDLLPRIKGLYSKEQLASTDLAYVEPEVDAIPVYLSAGTKLFMESMEETSGSCDYGEHKCNLFRTGDKIKIGDVTVEPVHVDHSIPAAYGFIIHTSAGAVVYTGDLRRHGPRRDLTEEFIERARDAEPVALITEGTRMADVERRQNYSEPQVAKLANDVVSSTDRMVFAARYSRDIDRLNSFYKVAKKNGRKLVINPKTAHLLTKLLSDEHLRVPDPLKDDNIVVYFKRKRSGAFDESDYYVWEREFMDKMVTHDYVGKNQKSLIMDLDFPQLIELVDIKPKLGSHFIHSMSEPFSEEDVENNVLHNWIDHFKMQFHQMHASGHMSKDDLVEMVNYIKPKRGFPVHTENQQLFRSCCSNVQTVKQGKGYTLK
jgi:ribonuclease J